MLSCRVRLTRRYADGEPFGAYLRDIWRLTCLASLAEILADETHLSGCGFDDERVWTSTRDGCEEGEVDLIDAFEEAFLKSACE